MSRRGSGRPNMTCEGVWNIAIFHGCRGKAMGWGLTRARIRWVTSPGPHLGGFLERLGWWEVVVSLSSATVLLSS